MVCLAVFMTSPLLYAEPSLPVPKKESALKYKKGQIILYVNDNLEPVKQASQAQFYRKYLGTTAEGYYLIQDFYTENNKKASDPMTVKLQSDLRSVIPKSLEGLSIYWYENGQKRAEGQFIKGKAEGLYTGWHENGQKFFEGQYKNGKKEGLWTWWHENGQKMTEERHKNTKREGVWTDWHENGQKKSEEQYKNGEREGVWTEWHENGQKKSEGHFKSGRPVGKWSEWDENGIKLPVDSKSIIGKYYPEFF